MSLVLCLYDDGEVVYVVYYKFHKTTKPMKMQSLTIFNGIRELYRLRPIQLCLSSTKELS